ncbi:MAG: hypothetical protein ACTTH8_05875 [Treponema sp.]
MTQRKVVSVIGTLVLIMSAACITGCQLVNDEKSQIKTTSEYIGSYEGVSSGEVSGLWTVKIDKTGIITGEFKQSEKTFPISGNVKNDGTFTASANIRAAIGVITISGTIDKKSGKILGTIENDSKKSALCGYKQTESVEAVDKNLFSVWKLQSLKIKIEEETVQTEYPTDIPIDENDSSKTAKMDSYFLFLENNELYQAAEISGVPNPSPAPNVSNGLFKAKQHYTSAGKQIALFSDGNGFKMNMVGAFNITENNLIIEGIAKINIAGEEILAELQYTFEKVSSPTVNDIKNALDIPVIKP